MNIYDFDDTIFDGDSSVYFIKYSLVRHPFLVILSLFKTIIPFIKYKRKKTDFGNVKAVLFSFVTKIKEIDTYMDNFVLKYQDNIKPYYLELHKSNDVIISASFRFIVEPLCKKMDINNVIATEYDVKTGKLIGKNCKSEEKIRRFNELYKDVIVDNAYSDSLTDIPMFERAKKGYIVKGYDLIEYKK